MKRGFVIALLLLATTTAYAGGPPLITDDTGTVDPGKVEIEFNGSTSYDRETTGGVTTRKNASDLETKINTGLYKNLGIDLIIPYTFSERAKEDGNLVENSDGFGDMTLEVKYVFAELAGINFAIKPYTIMPTGKYSNGLSEGRWQYGGALIATREFEEGTYALHANVGYEHHDYRTDDARAANRNDLWSGSVAGEAKVWRELTAVADFGLATTQDRSTSELSAYGLVGVRYPVNEHLDVNAGVKLGLTKPEDDVSALYGIVLKF